MCIRDRLGVEIQSNQGSWRLEDRYPMSETTEILWELGSAELSAAGGSNTIFPDANSGPVYETPPLEENLYFGGLPRLHVNVNTVTVGGQIYALLEDCDGSTCIHIGHAIMDLRYHEGGGQEQTWIPIFETINAKMEFFAIDAQIEEGHTLRISLASTGEDYLPASTSSIVEISEGSNSNLLIDIIQPGGKILFDPPACTHQYCLDWLEQ